MLNWSDLSAFQKFMTVLCGVLAVGTAGFVFGYGYLWFKKAPSGEKETK